MWSVAQALMPAASPLLGTLLVRHGVTCGKSVETSLDTAGTSACATSPRAGETGDSHQFPRFPRAYTLPRTLGPAAPHEALW